MHVGRHPDLKTMKTFVLDRQLTLSAELLAAMIEEVTCRWYGNSWYQKLVPRWLGKREISMLRTMNAVLLAVSCALLGCAGCAKSTSEISSPANDSTASTQVDPASADQNEKTPVNETETKKMQKVTLGAGCFWCIEAVLDRVKGVESVVSGYMGGDIENPTYEQICTGTTNHAEVVEVTFDPEIISFDQLLEVFWQLHDPTTLNRQGFDVGTQYRSAIFFHDDEQRASAEESKKKWDDSGKFPSPIVTEITPAVVLYPAELYHQEYFEKNPGNPYCRANILPKFKKLGLLREAE